jgi:hypothetical protein
MVVLAIITSLFIAIQDPIVQKFAVRFAGGYLSEKTGADVKVGRLIVTPDFRVIFDDVMVKDLNDNTLAKIGALRTKINITELLDDKIHLENVELRDTEANLITYAGEDKMNFAFLVDAFASDKPKEKESKPMEIIVDKISLKNVDFMLWDQNKSDSLKTAKHLMDYSHLDLDDIFLEARDFYMKGDSIRAAIANLSAKELSGLDLKRFQADAIVSQSGIRLNGMQMETNNSRFDMDLNMLYNGFDDFSSFVDSVVFDANIRPTDVMLSDIGVFTEVMYKMPNKVNLEGHFTGPIEHFRLDDMKVALGKSTSFQGSISMHPLNFENGYHTLNIKNMRFNYDDLANFYIPSKTETIPIPESLRPMGDSRLSLNFRGSYNDFKSDINLASGIGDIDASISRSKFQNGDNLFDGYIRADRVKAGTIANATKYIGDLDMNADFSIMFPQKGNPELSLDGQVSQIKLLGKNVDVITLKGAMEENLFKGYLKIDDDDIALDFNGLIDFQNTKHPKSDFEADIHYVDLGALKLIKGDTISKISTKIYANMTGFDLDDLEGSLSLDSTLYRDSRGSYFMESFNASIINDNLMQRRIKMNCDFFNFEMAGQMNFASLLMTLNEYADSFVHFPIWEENREKYQEYKEEHEVDQDFTVQLTLKDTETLSRLLMPSVKIAKNTTLNGTFTSRNNALNLTVRSKNVQVGSLDVSDIELKHFSFMNTAITTLGVDEIAFAKENENDTTAFGLDNISIITRMTNDTVFARLRWDDDELEDHNKALIETYFHPHEKGGIFSVTNADVHINDSVWSISPDNYIDLTDGRTLLSNILLNYNSQSIRLDGYVPMALGDTLSVAMRQFDLSNLDVLFKRAGFDVDGFVSGDAVVSSLKEKPMVLANLEVQRLGLNGNHVGDALIKSLWNNEDKSVDLNVNILNNTRKTLNMYGSYYTARKTDNLDFTIELDSLQLNVLNPFLSGIVTRMQGFGNGKIAVTGSLQQPDIQGRLAIKDGGCKIDYLNTFYTFNPTILVDNKTITFENMMLTDTVGNRAFVEGKINHNKLKDFDLDLRLYPRDFLALATTRAHNDTFYGTAVASGFIRVSGPFKDIKLDINALTSRGTNVTIPLNKSAKVKDNDFIIFVNNAEESEEEEEVIEVVKSKFGMNLNVTATDDANLKIILPNNLGTIEATGNGNVNMSTATSEDFKMFGNYTIKNGRFQLNLMDLVSRTFNLKSGGSLSWTGDPTDGRISATGSYSVRASLSSLGLQVDSTANNSNVNVECLIHLNGALLNPSLTFGMRLPNASEDITQTVFSIVDTTNQALMQQQALSLLVLNSFSYVGAGTANVNIYNVLGAGMQMNITDNINVGLNYHAGTANTFDEYQLALRTHFFENRLTIETNVGMMTSYNANNASSIVGEFDMYYKLTQDGRLQAHFYNHSNYNSNFNSLAFDRRSPYTQGLGLSYSRSFNTLRDLFKKRSTTINSSQPLLRPRKKENN